MATATQNGYTNGVNGTHADQFTPSYIRFSEVPNVIDIPVGDTGDEAVNLELTSLQDDIEELCDLLQAENAARTYWITIALAYVKGGKANVAIDMLNQGLAAFRTGRAEDRLHIWTCLCWLHMWKARHAPRVRPTQSPEDERTKDHFLQTALQSLNEALKIRPDYPPLALARGTLYLLRASLQPSKSAAGSQERSERTETLKDASKAFDEAFRQSQGKNVMALMGKAKAQFSLGSVGSALQLYQQALEKSPDMIDPDPRIGIGCCLWQLGHKENARAAWQRSLDLNENSKIAHALLGLYYLDESHQYATTDEAFAPIYKKAMTTHIQAAFKLDGMDPLVCATFGSYFLLRKQWQNVDRLAKRAIEYTDVNAIASDGWYLLARQDHYEGNLQKAAEHYAKADQARGGDEKGYLPAKFGAAQLRTLMQDYDGAKFRLEKMVEKNKSAEALTLLGILHAEAVFSNTAEDKALEAKRAIAMLEQVRTAWKDSKRKLQKDRAVLINLARLYEAEQPEKALACLLDVEEIEMAEISEDDLPDEMGDEAEERQMRRELLNPQLLNNIGCFRFQAEKFNEAREDFQTALNACVKLGAKQEDGSESVDTDALVSTISYNLGRTYEAENMDEDAQKIYDGLLLRHPDYIDANSRLAYLALKSDPAQGAEAIKSLMESDPTNLEVRSLYGWYIHRAKKRTLALNEDQEQRHYKHTLQTYNKHDLYALTGMGNLHLAVAREMPRDTDAHKERRSKTYMRAVEFFDKVLALDPRNAYAAQGMGIAIAEDKRDTATAIQIFSKVRESVKDASVHINLGHIFTEVKQFSRAIENYELALAKKSVEDGKGDGEGGREPQILSYLGRVWLMRGRQEKKLEAYKTSLEFSKEALKAASAGTENVKESSSLINFRFNVAFVQIQLAQMLNALPEAQRTLADVEAAAQGLDEAIEAFGEIAKAPNPPFPRGDIEQRANMGRNTMKRQLASAVERQREYETKNASRLEEARKKREEEKQRREAEQKAAKEKEEEKQRKVREERERMAEEDRLLIERRLEEEKAREAEQWTTDEETGERKKREKKPRGGDKKRKKKRADDASDTEGLAGTTDAEGGRSRPRSGVTSATGSDGEPRRKKKRKLEQRKGRATSSKYKSADIVEDSSDDEDVPAIAAPKAPQPLSDAEGDGDENGLPETPGGSVGEEEPPAEEFEDEEEAVARPSQRKKIARILDDDEDEDEEEPQGVAEAGGSDHGGDALGSE